MFYNKLLDRLMKSYDIMDITRWQHVFFHYNTIKLNCFVIFKQ